MPNPRKYSAPSSAEQPRSPQQPKGLPGSERDAASGAVDPSANGHRAAGAAGSRSAARSATRPSTRPSTRPAFRPVGAPIRVRRERAAAHESTGAVEAVEQALL